MLPVCFCIDYWSQINLHQQDLIKMWCSDSPKYLLKYNIRDTFDSLEDYRDCCGEEKIQRVLCKYSKFRATIPATKDLAHSIKAPNQPNFNRIPHQMVAHEFSTAGGIQYFK